MELAIPLTRAGPCGGGRGSSGGVPWCALAEGRTGRERAAGPGRALRPMDCISSAGARALRSHTDTDACHSDSARLSMFEKKKKTSSYSMRDVQTSLYEHGSTVATVRCLTRRGAASGGLVQDLSLSAS